MATMGCYCKAYSISRFEEYPKWTEKPVEKKSEPEPPRPPQEGQEPEPPMERYLFLQENLVVTDGIFLDEDIVFDDITPEWEEFCHNTLKFEIPKEALPDAEPEVAAQS